MENQDSTVRWADDIAHGAAGNVLRQNFNFSRLVTEYMPQRTEQLWAINPTTGRISPQIRGRSDSLR